MRTLIGIACLGLLAWTPASAADQSYALTVSRHPSVRGFSDSKVKEILHNASTVLHRAGCNVTFTLDGSVRKFSSSSAPSTITTDQDLDAVHSEPTDVKIVRQIHCCVEKKGDFAGCSWPPKAGSRSIIMTEDGAMLGNRWAHEFGHRMGLQHRGDKSALMTGTGVTGASVQISAEECSCFLHEGSCTLPPQQLPAAQDRCPK